jgi:isopenicillin-N epimerase
VDRRRLLNAIKSGLMPLSMGAIGGASAVSSAENSLVADFSTPDGPQDEAGWERIAKAYPSRPDDLVNLEYGAFGQMSRTVEAAFTRYTAKVNQEGASFTRRGFFAYEQALRQAIASAISADPSEIALTRNATEALQALIGGYRRLRRGDAVLIADHDYDSMKTAMAWLNIRRGVEVVKIVLPHPATHQGLIDAYERALISNPKVRMMLLTHLGHLSGLRLPVREIITMARARGVDVIVDSAHAWGQGPLDVKALGFDFAGFNLHKWIGAPLGVGAVYIRQARVDDIEPYMGEVVGDRDPIAARVHTGTVNFAAQMAAIDALKVQGQIGSEACEQRFSYLRNLWVEPGRDIKTIEILTPDDPRLHIGITSFRLKSDPSPAAHTALAKRLVDEFGLFTVTRIGLDLGACIRVTPGFTSRPEDMLALSRALQQI